MKIISSILPVEYARDSIVLQLTSAYCDEILAAHAYQSASYMVVGKGRRGAAEELKQHAEEEYKHAEILAERIAQLSGVIPTKMTDICAKATCIPLTGTTIFDTKTVTSQAMEDELCAINKYKGIIAQAEVEKDYATVDLLSGILAEEEAHFEDFRKAYSEGNTF